MSRAPTHRTSMIETALDDPRWFGDGAPTWLECAGRSSERHSQTSDQARQQRCDAVRALRRYGKDELADKLSWCSRRERCLSGACPECCRALQRWFVDRAATCMRTCWVDPVLMVTIAPDFGQLDEGANETDVTTVWRKTARLLRQFNVQQAIGALDFSVNIDQQSARPYVQVQHTLFVPKNVWPKSDNKLRSALNRSGRVPRPLHVAEFDGAYAGLAYALKSEFNLRERYRHIRWDRRICANTRLRPVRGEAWVKLMLLLDRLGLDARLNLLGVKRIRSGPDVIMHLIE